MERTRLWLGCKLLGFEFNLKMDSFSTMLAFRLPAARIDSIQMLHVFCPESKHLHGNRAAGAEQSNLINSKFG